MYRTRTRRHRKGHAFKKRVAHGKRKSKKYNSFRVARGGIRL